MTPNIHTNLCEPGDVYNRKVHVGIVLGNDGVASEPRIVLKGVEVAGLDRIILLNYCAVFVYSDDFLGSRHV